MLSIQPGGEEVFAPIREGMIAMGQTLSALRGLEMTVACKTGSPQRAETLPDGSHYTNSVLIAYAPAEQPRVAVAIVLEYGGRRCQRGAAAAGSAGSLVRHIGKLGQLNNPCLILSLFYRKIHCLYRNTVLE